MRTEKKKITNGHLESFGQVFKYRQILRFCCPEAKVRNFLFCFLIKEALFSFLKNSTFLCQDTQSGMRRSEKC